ncbi:TSUP family transporter [Nocardioides lijunqiniae]|uniref:TSUP family transporter n=1 Tax=Nocardioides lijunqiniae TaxID=2760832 RepID=UPI0018780674
MSTGEALLVALAGVGAGLTGSVAGLASLISYPALLATGLPPLAANVTNTTSMLGNAVGTTIGSRRELVGQWRRLRTLMVLCGAGGSVGATLLLVTDPSVFEAVVPWLVALGALLLLLGDRLRAWSLARRREPTTASRWRGHLVVASIGVYGGYFGAGAGIIMLAALALRTTEPLAVTNAVKNVTTSTANLVAALAYMVVAPVDWAAAAALASGSLVGGWIGPQLVRVLPEKPLRIGIGLAGLGLAAYLLLA